MAYHVPVRRMSTYSSHYVRNGFQYIKNINDTNVHSSDFPNFPISRVNQQAASQPRTAPEESICGPWSPEYYQQYSFTNIIGLQNIIWQLY